MNVAFLFPGQGSQFVGMGKELCENFKQAKLVFEEAGDALSMRVDKLCFDGPERELVRTENTQPATLTVSVAALRVFEAESEVRPVVSAGHSLGEYSALVASGALNLADAVRLVKNRGKFMQEAAPEGKGAMAAIIGLEAETVESAVNEISGENDEVVVIANYNSPEQSVISGHAGAVRRAVEKLKDAGAKKAIFLNVSAPFHSPLMKPAAERLREKLAEVEFGETRTPVIANVDASVYGEPGMARDALERQVHSPVLWNQSMEKLDEFGVDKALELGPGKVLTGLLKLIRKEIECLPVGDSASLKKALDAV